jgi:transposase
LANALASLDAEFEALYTDFGRPSIPPERLIRASLLQTLFSVRSERQLMEQMNCNLMFRWFVGLGIDDPVWVPTVFTKNRDRLLSTEMSRKVMAAVLAQALQQDLRHHYEHVWSGTGRGLHHPLSFGMGRFSRGLGKIDESPLDRRRAPSCPRDERLGDQSRVPRGTGRTRRRGPRCRSPGASRTLHGAVRRRRSSC